MAHIDWLTVRQSHGNAPIFAEAEVSKCDVVTGEMMWRVYAGVSEQGSFSSTLRVRSDGDVVEVSGNPSRWNREENLFGVRSVDAALAIYNDVLAALGLPLFSEDERSRLIGRLLQGSDSLAVDGCRFTRVDITQNYSTGGPRHSEHALHALRSFRHRNKPPIDYGSTLMWGAGSRYVSMKYYLKGPEMRAHRKRTAAGSKYWDDVLSFVEREGILRFEVCCKSEFLRRSGLDRPGVWTDDVMASIVNGYAVHNRAQSSVSSMNDIKAALMECGLKECRAERCQQMALAYLSGHKLRGGMSNATFYRWRKDLLLVGIDINADLNVSSLRFSVEQIKLQPTAIPAWYREA